MNDENLKLKEELSNSKPKLYEFSNKISDQILFQNSVFSDKIQNLFSKFKNFNIKFAEISQINSDLKLENQKLSNKIYALISENSQLLQKIEINYEYNEISIQTEPDPILDENTNLKLENQKLISECENLHDQISKQNQIISEYDTKKSIKSENEISELKSTIQKQTINLKKCIAECRRLQAELLKNESEKQNLLKIHEELKMKNSDTEILYEKSKEIIQNLETKIKNNEYRIETLENEVIRTKQDLAESINTMHEFEVEHSEYIGIFEKKMTFKEKSPDNDKI